MRHAEPNCDRAATSGPTRGRPVRVTRHTVTIVLALFALTTVSSHASEEFAGWRAVDTPHFTVIFEPAHEAAAQEVIHYSDEVYAQVTAFMNYRPPERVPVVIRGRTALANGFFAPLPNRITLFVTSPSGPWLGAQTESWLKLLFIHEFMHYVHLTRPQGFFGAARPLFGPLTPLAAYPFMPGWMVEAPTTYAETVFTNGGRGRNAFTTMEFAAPIIEGSFWSYDQAGFSWIFAPRGRIYVAGYLITDHLERTYGPGTLEQIQTVFANLPFLGMRRAIRRVTGVSAPQMHDHLERELQHRFLPRRQLPTGALVHPNVPGDFYAPIVRGEGIYQYRRTATDGGAIVRADLSDTTDVAARWRIVQRLFPTDPWSFDVDADERSLLYTRVTETVPHPAGMAEQSDLYEFVFGDVTAGAAGHERRITTGRRLQHPRYAPGGRYAVAVEVVGSYSRLVAIDLTNGHLTPLYHNEQSSLFTPTFSPDGSLIAFVENQRGFQDIVVANWSCDGERPLICGLSRPLGESTVGHYFPRFDHAGNLLFGADADGELAVYRLTLPGPGVAGPPQAAMLMRDRVGAFEAIDVDSQLWYGSYSGNGYRVRAVPNAESAPTPLAPLTPSNQFAPQPVPFAPMPEPRPYRDSLRPSLWAPTLFLRSTATADGSTATELDLGVYFLAASVLERQQLVAMANHNPWLGQPSLMLNYAFRPRRTTFSLDLTHNYRTTIAGGSPLTTLATDVVLGAGRPLAFHQRAGDQRLLSGAVSLRYRHQREALGSLSLPGTLQAQPPASADSLTAAARLRATRRNTPLLAALYGRGGSVADAQFAVRPSVLGNAYRSVTQMELAVTPRVWRNVVADARLQGAFPSDGSTTGLLPSSTLDWRQGSGDARAVASIGVSVPIALFDGAWRGIALTGLGQSFFLRQAGYLNRAEAARVESFAVVGTEVTLFAQYNILPFHLKATAELRVPHPQSPLRPDWVYTLKIGSALVDSVLPAFAAELGR